MATIDPDKIHQIFSFPEEPQQQQPSGGVRSLRAMFESNGNHKSPSLERGRSQGDSSSTDPPRPLSRVRSVLVPVGGDTPPRGSSSNPVPDAAIIEGSDRRQSFSLLSKEDLKELDSIRKIVSQEMESREEAHKDPVPEQAVVSTPGTPVVAGTPRKTKLARKTPTKVENTTPRSTASNSKTSAKLPTRIPAGHPPRNKPKPIAKPSPIQTHGTTPSRLPKQTVTPRPSNPRGDPTMPQHRPTTGYSKSGTNADFAQTFGNSSVITSSGDIQTSPAGEAPTTPREASAPFSPTTRGLLDPLTTEQHIIESVTRRSSSEALHEVIANDTTLPVSSAGVRAPLTDSEVVKKSVQVAKDNLKAGTSVPLGFGPASGQKKKIPYGGTHGMSSGSSLLTGTLTPSEPHIPSWKQRRARETGMNNGNGHRNSTGNGNGNGNSNGSSSDTITPKVKSPTISSIPETSRLFAPTASTAARSSNPAPAPHVVKRPTPAAAPQSRRPSSLRNSTTMRSSLGSTKGVKPDADGQTKKPSGSRVPSADFLARMTRPTAASKAHAKDASN